MGVSVFLLTAALILTLIYQNYLIRQDKKRRSVERELNLVKDKVKTILSQNLSSTKTLAYIIKNYGVPNNFNAVAKNILESNKYGDALQLTRKGVITHVYPLKGNEASIGLDILKDPTKKFEAIRAIEKKTLFFAGPFELKQGGVAIVGRLPIFIDTTFWGFSAVILRLPTLIKAAGIDTLQGSDFIYQLSKINPITKKEEFFLPDILPGDKKQSASFYVSEGEWRLYVVSKDNSSLLLSEIGFIALTILFSVICGLFAYNIGKQPEKLKVLVNERTEKIQSLTVHLENIREEERTRIAREIHDELGQQLTCLKMDASWVLKKIVAEDGGANKRILGMISLIDDTIQTVRRIASELRPGMLDDLGLAAAIEWQSQELEKRTGIRSVFKTNIPDFNPARQVSTNIFRVYQEALTNITRYANATEVQTTLYQKDNYIELLIQDNGVGFNIDEVKHKNSLGLIGMKERVVLFNGTILIDSTKSKGTAITIKIPLNLKENIS